MRIQTDKKFLKRINELRGKQSKAAFARQCGINPTTMLGYLNGTSNPLLENLRKIAAALGVTVGWLVDDETVIYRDVTDKSQTVIGNGQVVAGKEIKGNVSVGEQPQTRMEGFLDDDERELILMMRDLGGKRVLNKFKRELLELQKFIDGE